MITVFLKEIKQYWRDGRVLAVLAIMLLLSAASVASGWNTVSALERERAAAEATDRNVWDTQGEKNPHTAAHFSRYVFQPTYNLAMFDQGLSSFVGKAVWLEAHYRDPPALRAVEDAVEIQRIAELSPAWVIQVFAPLLVIALLFGSFAGERESGTLRQLLGSGVSAGAMMGGKVLAAFALTATVVIGVLFGSVLLMRAPGVESLPDSGVRAAGLLVLYVVYLAIFVFFAVGFSALFRSARSALIGLLGIWVAATLAAPRVASDVMGGLSPAPSVPVFAERLENESSAPFWGSGDDAVARRRAVTEGLLAEYGVETVEELPINYDGYLLQASEEFANDVFDEMYDELWGSYERQRDLARVFTVVSPTIAVQNISMALSGTDLFGHRHFADSAEQFRREFVLLLNQEMIEHGGADGYAYMSGNDFWRQNPDFAYAAPSVSEAVEAVRVDALILSAWLIGAIAIAVAGVRRGVLMEARS